MKISESPAPVLFFAPFGAYNVHHQLDAVLATALRARGVEVAAIRCDGLLPICDQHSQGDNREKTCSHCQACGNSLFSSFGVPCIQLRATLTDFDYKTAENWAQGLGVNEYSSAVFDGLPIGQWVTPSLCSYYRITAGVLRDSVVQAKTLENHRQLLVSGLLTYWSVTRMIAHIEPSHMVCFNARMASYRVAFEAARAMGVEVITHERGFRDDTFTLFSNYGSIQTQPVYDAFNTWKDIPLNHSELAKVGQYFDNRERGTDLNFDPFLDFATDYSAVRAALRVPADARLIGVFTSSEYEFSLCRDYDTFIDQLQFIERLMVVFRERPNDYLVVRHHPYLGGSTSSLADHEFINKAMEAARLSPRNVRIVMPGERLNSYALMNNLDGAIAFLSTAGVESVSRGVATACFEQSAYRDALTECIQDDGKRYLHALIDRLIAKTATFGVEDLRRLYRFQNTLISKLSNEFKTFGIKDIYAPLIKTENIGLIIDGGDEALDRACDHILKGSPLLPQPREEQRLASTRDEDDFLSARLEMTRSLRQRVRKETTNFEHCKTDHKVAVVTLGKREARPVGLETSRHTSIHLESMGEPEGLTYDDLARCIEAIPADLVTVASSHIEYDEAFISYAVDSLSKTEQDNKIGVLYGAWIRQSTGHIGDQIFSKRHPRVSLDRLKQLCPNLATEPYRLLSLVIFKKEAGLDFLHALGKTPFTSPHALEPIYAWLSRDSFDRCLGHGIVLPQ